VLGETVEVKITDGFTAEYEATMQVGELIMNKFPEYSKIKKAVSDIGLCHYIFCK
jgi:hypothetical protein